MAVYYDDLFEDEVANDGDPHRKIQMIMESAAAILEEKKTLETFFKLDVLNIEHIEERRWNSSKWEIRVPTDCMKHCHRGNELCLCMMCGPDLECHDKCQSEACPQSEDKCKGCDLKKSYECLEKCHQMDGTISKTHTQRYFLMAILLTVTIHLWFISLQIFYFFAKHSYADTIQYCLGPWTHCKIISLRCQSICFYHWKPESRR